jgi:hypothetical protein
MKERREMSIGVFNDRESAERAYQDLIARGYTKDEISVVMTDDTRKKYFTGKKSDLDDDNRGDRAMKGAGVGGTIGGAVGATLTAIAAAATSLAIPGLGLVIAGPIAGALAGGAAGGAAGSIVGALVGAGIPDDDAKRYEKNLKQGGILLSVHPKNPQDYEYLDRQFQMRSTPRP